MPKTYALLDVDHTLVIDNKTYNYNLLNALKNNNIKDVYLFTDMTFRSTDITDRKELVRILQAIGLTVHGVLTTPDLFWATNAEELQKVELAMQQQNINLREGRTISADQIEALRQSCPTIASYLLNGGYHSYANLGAAYRDVDTPDIFSRATGAKAAADILSTLLPNKPHPKALLFKHFMPNRPADCTNCIIFDDKGLVLESSLAISEDKNTLGYGLNVLTIQVMNEDFEGNAAQERYNSQIRNFLPIQNQVQDSSSTASPPAINSNADQQSWIDSPSNRWLDNSLIQTIQREYTDKRGYKLFGYSSDDSVKLLTNLNIQETNSCTKQTIVNRYLATEKNQGKRLYDILIEEKIRHTPLLQNNEDVWLTEDMVYLIDQKYKQKRGFKFFGYSCPESVTFLEILRNKQFNLKVKQDAIEGYLADENHRGKRLFDVLTEVNAMCPNAPAPRRNKL